MLLLDAPTRATAAVDGDDNKRCALQPQGLARRRRWVLVIPVGRTQGQTTVANSQGRKGASSQSGLGPTFQAPPDLLGQTTQTTGKQGSTWLSGLGPTISFQAPPDLLGQTTQTKRGRPTQAGPYRKENDRNQVRHRLRRVLHHAVATVCPRRCSRGEAMAKKAGSNWVNSCH